MLRKKGEEGGNASRLQTVFGKLGGVFMGAPELGAPKTMSSEVIETVLADAPIKTAAAAPRPGAACLTVARLAVRLEEELRSAKRSHLSCGQVLLPCGLLQRIAADIVSMAESEPYGVRGCTIFLNFEGVAECRKLGQVKCDPGTATTFELNVTLHQDTGGWSFIPQFLKKLGRGGTIIISAAYIISKKKLYRSNME